MGLPGRDKRVLSSFSAPVLQSHQSKQSLPKSGCRTVPWLHSLLGFAFLFLLVVAWSYNMGLSWCFSSSLCKRSQGSMFLYVAISAVVRNTLTEKPILIFCMSKLHISARKNAEGGLVFVLSFPFAVALFIICSMLACFSTW